MESVAISVHILIVPNKNKKMFVSTACWKDFPKRPPNQPTVYSMIIRKYKQGNAHMYNTVRMTDQKPQCGVTILTLMFREENWYIASWGKTLFKLCYYSFISFICNSVAHHPCLFWTMIFLIAIASIHKGPAHRISVLVAFNFDLKHKVISLGLGCNISDCRNRNTHNYILLNMEMLHPQITLSRQN